MTRTIVVNIINLALVPRLTPFLFWGTGPSFFRGKKAKFLKWRLYSAKQRSVSQEAQLQERDRATRYVSVEILSTAAPQYE